MGGFVEDLRVEQPGECRGTNGHGAFCQRRAAREMDDEGAGPRESQERIGPERRDQAAVEKAE